MRVDDSTTALQRLLDLDGAGDPKARDELLAHCRQRLRLLTHQMLRRFPGVHKWEDTSDVLQNVLVRLDRAMSAVQIATVQDFLRLAAAQIRRHLIELARHYHGPLGQGSHQAPPGSCIDQDLANRALSNGDDPLQLSEWTEFHQYISKLDEQDRDMFDLVYYQGLSQPSAAKLMGMALTTFKRRWQDLRLRLATELGDHLPE
jgi:RNA polymerase sigma-70 factor (ECF subfamily)